MMPYLLYDHVAPNGRNEFAEWTRSLENKERGKLASRLDKLQQLGMELLPEMLTGTDTPGILKLRIRGNVQLRPMLCQGPIQIGTEFTLLLGATEVGGRLQPPRADNRANDIKEAIKASPETRRKKHEHVR